MVRRVTPSQLRSQLRQAQAKRKQAIDKLNRDVRTYNQKVRSEVNRYNQAVNQYNAKVRAHNSRVRANRNRLRQELANWHARRRDPHRRLSAHPLKPSTAPTCVSNPRRKRTNTATSTTKSLISPSVSRQQR